MLTLWTRTNEELDSRRVDGAIDLMVGAEAVDRVARPPRLLPVRAAGGAIAALLVPVKLHAALARNGVPLSAGLHLLGHTDRIDFAGQPYWVAASAQAAVAKYLPDEHGADVYCFITKARLQPGDEIVICPGRPGVECRTIYRRQAWEMAVEGSERFRCPHCGFDPLSADWQPQVERRGNLDRLLELAAARGRTTQGAAPGRG